MRYPNPYILLYIAIGDAYCAGTEYLHLPDEMATRDEALKFEKYVKHPRHKLGAGKYTDDGEMSVGTAWVLIENDPPYTELMFANSWVREFARGDQRDGYSPNFYKFLKTINTGEEFLKNINPNSNKNGAGMRVVPIGVLRTVPEVIEVSTLQAKITHNTPEGIFCSRAIALMSHYALYENPKKPIRKHALVAVREYCLDNLPKEDIAKFGHVFDLSNYWRAQPVVGTDKYSVAISTVHAVVELVAGWASPNLRDILEQTIRWGGDTDSVAAIALGIASTRAANRQDGLPEFLSINLEHGNPKTGAKYLLDVGTQLMEKFK